MFGINFGLPSGIFVDDFDNMSLEFKQMYGFCNLLPCELYKGKVIPPKIIFYNTFEHQNKQQHNMSKIFSWECLDFYRQKSRLLFANELCEYALKSPLDAVASDISKRLCGFLENNENSFANSPYEKQSFWKKIIYLNKDNHNLKNEILKNFYNGDFKIQQ